MPTIVNPVNSIKIGTFSGSWGAQSFKFSFIFSELKLDWN